MYGGYLVESSLARRPIPLEIFGRPYFIGKYTTAWDLARLERALHLAAGARGALIWRFPGAFTPSEARYLLYVLAHSRTRGGLTPVWGGGVTVLHKAGWITKARHDSGLVYSSGGAFVVSVLTWNGGGSARPRMCSRHEWRGLQSTVCCVEAARPGAPPGERRSSRHNFARASQVPTRWSQLRRQARGVADRRLPRQSARSQAGTSGSRPSGRSLASCGSCRRRSRG